MSLLIALTSFSSLQAEVLSFDTLSLEDQALVLSYYQTALGTDEMNQEEAASLFNNSTEEDQKNFLNYNSLPTNPSSLTDSFPLAPLTPSSPESSQTSLDQEENPVDIQTSSSLTNKSKIFTQSIIE